MCVHQELFAPSSNVLLTCQVQFVGTSPFIRLFELEKPALVRGSAARELRQRVSGSDINLLVGASTTAT